MVGPEAREARDRLVSSRRRKPKAQGRSRQRDYRGDSPTAPDPVPGGREVRHHSTPGLGPDARKTRPLLTRCADRHRRATRPAHETHGAPRPSGLTARSLQFDAPELQKHDRVRSRLHTRSPGAPTRTPSVFVAARSCRSTPEQRLAWLQSALQLAYQSGALKPRRPDARELPDIDTKGT